MPRYGQRTTEESSAAGSEALRGAVVGGAKVRTHLKQHPHASVALYLSSAPSPAYENADNAIVTVGTALWGAGYRWILPLAHLQKLDCPIQSVRLLLSCL